MQAYGVKLVFLFEYRIKFNSISWSHNWVDIKWETNAGPNWEVNKNRYNKQKNKTTKHKKQNTDTAQYLICNRESERRRHQPQFSSLGIITHCQDERICCSIIVNTIFVCYILNIFISSFIGVVISVQIPMY